MVSAVLEVFGLGLCVIGWLLVMLACGLPMWKVTAFIDGNIVLAQTVWDGLWMTCVVQSTGQMQCKTHDSMLSLTRDLQAARALTIISSVLGVFGLLVTIAGAQCTNCIQGEGSKVRIVNAGGVTYIVSGFLLLIPLCWMAHRIIVDFYDPQVPSPMKREMGAALYIGWAATALLFVGGGMLCCSCPQRGASSYAVKYAPPIRAAQNGEYDKKNYV
ncbi:Claudin-5 [Acipenser ruthenus]|uniref:Claudin n=1 Tax=Acipenser ruthenus TaxID=7906 RepID=A0A444UZH8_ACIRT|nr:claudin-4-like [Acipenser ruthenus]XP_033901927.1 claudin-4-like [Acipenser ruthenus]RXM93560.1 Claudin-5 [Acipenser ruthenus]